MITSAVPRASDEGAGEALEDGGMLDLDDREDHARDERVRHHRERPDQPHVVFVEHDPMQERETHGDARRSSTVAGSRAP